MSSPITHLLSRFIPFVLHAMLFASVPCAAQPTGSDPPYLQPDLPITERVRDLVGRMSLEEKVKQTLYNAPAVERLGIPAYNWWNEALHGVARAGRATVFPQAIGLAAAWDTELLHMVATAISDEARAKHHQAARDGRRGIYDGLTFWSPNINLFRDPRWGRGMETYGEDPYLTGRLAVAFVRGMQGDDPRYLKTVATPKHFAVHSGPEPDRHTFDARVSERDLRESYLPHFRDAVMEGGAQSVMCAYNRFRGDPCCGSNPLLRRILRDEWGFDGYVVSDCWAIMDFYNMHHVARSIPEAAAMALGAGTDLNCGVSFDSLAVAVRAGLVSEALVDTAVSRLFAARMRLGMFDPPERVPFASIPYSVNDCERHRALALEAARKSIVLLKNERRMLPLPKDLKRIAVIGPNAAATDVLLGNYNGIPADPVSVLRGIREAAGNSAEILSERGCDIAQNMPSFDPLPSSALSSPAAAGNVPGLTAEYFGNRDCAGTPDLTRIDTVVDFNWRDGAPAPGVPGDGFSARWTGVFTSPVDGRVSLGLQAFGAARLYLDDSLLLRLDTDHESSLQWKNVVCTKGEPRRIRLEYHDLRHDASLRLLWSLPDPGMKRRALEAARSADAVVLCMGLSPRLEGEEMPVRVPGFAGGDRTDLRLPAPQEELIRDIAAIGRPTVLVLLNGSAVAIPWEAEHLPAILEVWYPGQAAGRAVADVLFGDYNPSGRLPVTFYSSVEQLPPFNDYDMKGRTYRFFAGAPLYPFGYGLSYTTFRYANPAVSARTIRPGDSVVVGVDVQNTGGVEGDEVVQLYLSHVRSEIPAPIRSLAGFRRVHLLPGQARRVSFTVSARQMSLIADDGARVIEPGTIELSVGGGQPGDGAAAAGSIVTVRVVLQGNRLMMHE
jgi:beta-glucosidase